MDRDKQLFPETRAERKKRLLPFVETHSTCPTTDGLDLEVWEELKAEQCNTAAQETQ